MDTPQIITTRTAYRPDGGTGVLAQHPFVAIDLETTGFSAENHRIVEIGAAKMAPDGTVLDTFSRVTNPGANVPLPPAAERIHHITAGEIRAARPLDEALDDLVAFVGNSGLVAHNISFEARFLAAAYARRGGRLPAWQGLCTLQTARRHIDADSHKLARLLELLGLPGVNSHRALDDAKACGVLAAYLISTMNVSALQPLTAGTGGTRNVDASTAEAIAVLQRDLGATVVGERSGETSRRPARTQLPTAAPPLSAHDRLKAAFGGHTPTKEQEYATELYLGGGDLKMTAVAGSGKSATLLAFARLDEDRKPSRRIFNLTFTRAVAEEARTKFPHNTMSTNVHSLARKAMVDTAYGPLLAKLGSELPPWSTTAEAILPRKVVVDLTGGPKLFSAYSVGRYALQAVNMFCRTLDARIGIEHMPDIPGVDRGSVAEQQLAEAALPAARRAWKHLLDPNSFAVGFQHDHYLKLYVDSRPTIGRPEDVLMFDEAQDANPIVQSLVAGQGHLQRVYVGDSAQSIYAFTGAVDALRSMRADHTATLSQSFRFGDRIAEAANVFMDLLDNPVKVRGNPAVDDVVDWTVRDVTAVLSRTNGGALAEVIAAQKTGRKAALVGDTKGALEFCDAARKLKTGQSPDGVKYAAFDRWSQLLEYVENQPDASDLATQTKLVEDHGVDTVEAALKSLVHPRRADTVVTTVHKAKGLEFDRVLIADDFYLNDDPDGSPMAPTPEERAEEQRLAYVAVTRAKSMLNPGLLLQPAQLSTQRTAPAGMLL
ncbi:exonuclease domain-containing protein [Gordonia aichiensis]|uniref:exonuclease domain-containing protein n=1 Tax=Gordonia aichiensis TaxID=36820 RepID=UPI0032676E91